jgi:hypothetical protein
MNSIEAQKGESGDSERGARERESAGDFKQLQNLFHKMRQTDRQTDEKRGIRES